MIKIVRPKKKAKMSLLDVGCGNGFFTKPFSRIFKTKGVDFSKRMVSLNPVKNCEVQDANNLKEKDNSYDIVFCSNLLHHLDSPEKAIKEMKRVSKKHIILSEPNRNNPFMFLFSLIRKEERGALKFSLGYLKKLCRSQNLKIVYGRTMGSIVPNKTPKWLLPFMKLVDNTPVLGFYILVIAQKKKRNDR
ncbi:TPA: class I SAM-dependent methyltransferase [Candidatus Woesearchaeota archaeon]|nr:class I SAM-dependent methyltransferase [Candidatus Woesearchaeota archaeon]